MNKDHVRDKRNASEKDSARVGSGKSRSISGPLAAGLIITVAMVATLAMALIYFYTDHKERKELNKKADTYLAYLTGTLEMSLWTLDYDTIRIIGKAVSQNELVVKLIITTSQGSETAIYALEKQHEPDLINRSERIFHNGNLLGAVELSLTKKLYRQNRKELLWSFAGITLLILISLALATGFLIRAFLKKPLDRLNAIVGAYAAGIYNAAFKESIPFREFKSLGNVLVDMGARIEKQFKELKEAEDKYRSIFENAIEGIFQTSPQGRFLNANPSMARITGYDSPAELIKKISNIGEQMYVESSRREELLRRLAQNDTVYGLEFELCRKDGSIIWASLNAWAVRDDLGKLIGIDGFLSDITTRKQAQEALAASRDFLDKIINSIGDPIFVKDRKHRWVLLNEAYCHFMGYSREELLGKSDFDFFPPVEAEVFWSKDEDVFSTGGENINEEQFTTAAGQTLIIVTKKNLYTDDKGEQFIVGIIRDMTEHKSLEDQLRQAVKLEAVGRLAGGVAHDFNNLMSIVLGYSELLRHRIGRDNPMCREVENIYKAGERAAGLTHQLLAFSRKQVVQPRVLDLNQVIAEIEKMLRRLIGENIELASVLDPALGRVVADPGLIEQVIMNLAINARDAMTRGGKLTIETANVYLDDDYARRHVGVTPGFFVLLAISDTGTGMDKQVLSHIFEPFFTTKDAGKGTGLGLATVYGIVEQSEGHIRVYSEPGQGTTFKIYLPHAEQEMPSEAAENENAPPLQGGSETILLVEDDDTVRELASEILHSAGYTVLEASNGEEAGRRFKAHDGKVHLLLTDVLMPGISGRELAKQLEPLNPEMKVLYMSGYTDDAIVHHGVLESGMAFLQKPLTPTSLTRKIRRVLDS